VRSRCRVNSLAIVKGVVISYLTSKHLPDAPRMLHRTLSLGRFKELVKAARKTFAVMITFRKSNKNSPLLEQVLKILPF
jgi:hypothetical protein